MQIKNNAASYGVVTIAIHWLMAVVLLGLYFSGDYMVKLDYYDTLYHTLPSIHKAIGVLIAFAFLFRIVWLYSHTRPADLPEISKLNHILAKLGHITLYLLILIMVISGYMISTAKGAGIDVFGLFEIPALLPADSQRAEFAGNVHEISTFTFLLVAIGHAGAALVHHFIMKDGVLVRMLGKGEN